MLRINCDITNYNSSPLIINFKFFFSFLVFDKLITCFNRPGIIYLEYSLHWITIIKPLLLLNKTINYRIINHKI